MVSSSRSSLTRYVLVLLNDMCCCWVVGWRGEYCFVQALVT